MPNKLIRANDGSLIGNSFFAVGSVQQTFLSAVEFESIMGTDWVLADGRDVSGSLYETITGNATAPDCRGMFLRTVGGNAEPTIGGTQVDATAVNGLNDGGGHRHATAGTDSSGSLSAATWNFTSTGPSGTALSIQTGFANVALSGDTETRPVNITVNTFIKIN